MGDTTLEDNEILKNIYYNLNNPASYSTVDKLYKAVDKKISKDNIKKWLRGELAYTLHKPRRINFKRNHYYIYTINEHWQADLMDLQSLSEFNDQYKYVLLIIDCLRRYVWTRALKTKKAIEVLKAFQSIVNEAKATPTFLVTDRGLKRCFYLNTLFAYYLYFRKRIFQQSVIRIFKITKY